ncbi:hypothetical protein Glove_43g32 [Diversispora epigaea]|uniref:Uncharacterized protein n=1 Tax=Diversispora epigaea TaxID=1348612 RepID=A0A397JJB2_9GLOM|nr:hypothetical protein Glove_43g32 [Diversispora epigaea]
MANTESISFINIFTHISRTCFRNTWCFFGRLPNNSQFNWFDQSLMVGANRLKNNNPYIKSYSSFFTNHHDIPTFLVATHVADKKEILSFRQDEIVVPHLDFPNEIHDEDMIIQLPFTFITDAPKNKTGISRLGGLGGTTMKKREDGLGYEGLDLTQIDKICQRKQTINRLLGDLYKKRIILVRSPPMAGKTSLAQLLEYSILQSDEVKKGLRCVFRISLMWMVKRGMKWTFAEGFKTLMEIEWGEFLDLCKKSDIEVILIVDEVQLIYKPQDENEPRYGGSIFWDTFKDIRQYLSNFHIVAFATYGHYGAYTTYGKHSTIDISPPSILNKDNTWGFEDVRFTEEEFNDYFNRFCEARLQMSKKDILPLSYYVSEITAFHPGLITFTMDQIFKNFVAILSHTSQKLTADKVFSYLKSHNFYLHLKDIRATPKVTDLTDEEKTIADHILFNKGE